VPVSPVDPLRQRLRRHLTVLYGRPTARWAVEALMELLEPSLQAHHPVRPRLFSERDVVLITYADQIREPDRPPLHTLDDFLRERVDGVISNVHLLPFFPYTSDDGFAVVDYTAVDPAAGTWEDVRRLSRHVGLMADAVVNHSSASAPWFCDWLDDAPDRAGFYRAEDPNLDVSRVTRPRTTPLLTPFDAADGTRHVWTTFGPDQVDLDYRNPATLFAMTEVILRYIAEGARFIRLDAVAFLWKDPATSSVHLPQTHEIVRLWRTVVDAVAPGTLLITETNVPHTENVGYFGNGDDEAHLVYQFPLAPLILSAFHLADSSTLQEWAATLRPPTPMTTFFNFLGSHDGIGLRPAEGMLTRAEIQHLCDLAVAHGGGVSYRTGPGGTMAPYELNTVFFDALNPVGTTEPVTRQVDRFLAAQSILLSLAGVPGIYVHALLGSRNWIDGVQATGRLRTINRQKLDRATLEAELDDPDSLRHRIFHRFLERIAVRCRQPAFHPSGPQRILATAPTVFAFERWAPDGSSKILCVHNLSGRDQLVHLDRSTGLSLRQGRLEDLLGGRPVTVDPHGAADVSVGAYGVRWLCGSQ